MLFANVEGLENRVLLSGTAVKPGSLDASFGSAGVVTGASATLSGQSVAVQSDGKVLVATTTSLSGLDSFSVTRYDANGSLDASFGSDGTATFNIDGENDQVAAIALQSNGQIIVAGNGVPSLTPDGSHILVARLNTDGTLDTSFGDGGAVVASGLAAFETASAVEVGADGSIVVAGAASDAAFGSNNSDILIDKFDSNGTPVSSFGDGGELLTQAPNANYSAAEGLAIQSDGSIVVSVTAQTGILSDPTAVGVYVMRFDSNGNADASFAGNSTPISTLSGDPGQLIVRPDGTILVTGSVSTKKNGSDLAVVALNANGTVDRKFGQRGMVKTSFGTYRQTSTRTTAQSTADAYAVSLEPDGTILVAGTVSTTQQQAVVVAYKAKGGVLKKFGKAGKVYVAASEVSGIPSLALSASGNPVVAVNTSGGFTISRYNAPT